MRLIDGDEFADMLSRVRRRLDPKIYKSATEFFTRDEMLLNLEQMVRAAPTIDPVKHGRWIGDVQYIGGFMAMECSNCHEIRIVDKYCPNCGAEMSNE